VDSIRMKLPVTFFLKDKMNSVLILLIPVALP
jgi:hypothetical protein